MALKTVVIHIEELALSMALKIGSGIYRPLR
jgi:hypothetical protein